MTIPLCINYYGCSIEYYYILYMFFFYHYIYHFMERFVAIEV